MKWALMYLSLISWTLASCAAKSPATSPPPIAANAAYMNNQIRLLAFRELSRFNTHDSIALRLEYDTTNDIVFPSNYNLRVFVWQADGWAEIGEKPINRPKQQIVLTPDNPLSYGQIVLFWPRLPDATKSYLVRAYVSGSMKSTDSAIEVGAFADFSVAP